jgi:ABC-type transport system involved in multi-copper enzyme maturation permease subunit
MSSAVDVVQTPARNNPVSWGLWLRQIRAILGLELTKNFLSRRSILIYLIAVLPLLPLLVLAVVRPPGNEFDFNNLGKIYAVFYHSLILRTVVFFGCAWIFMNLFRGEIVDRSLHYYFLSAVRREVLVAAKYISGLVTSIILFTATTVIALLLLYFPHYYSQSLRYFTEGRGLGQLLAYAGITMLACVGYGAFFLVVGLFIRNPIIPALLLYGWEWLNFLLPPLLKKFSVIHYLNSLMPVPISSVISEGPLAVVAEPTPAWISIPSMLLVTTLVLILAAFRTRHMEIRYGND